METLVKMGTQVIVHSGQSYCTDNRSCSGHRGYSGHWGYVSYSDYYCQTTKSRGYSGLRDCSCFSNIFVILPWSEELTSKLKGRKFYLTAHCFRGLSSHTAEPIHQCFIEAEHYNRRACGAKKLKTTHYEAKTMVSSPNIYLNDLPPPDTNCLCIIVTQLIHIRSNSQIVLNIS